MMQACAMCTELDLTYIRLKFKQGSRGIDTGRLAVVNNLGFSDEEVDGWQSHEWVDVCAQTLA